MFGLYIQCLCERESPQMIGLWVAPLLPRSLRTLYTHYVLVHGVCWSRVFVLLWEESRDFTAFSFISESLIYRGSE